MNSFGLGLILNFIDNASQGLGNATRAFQQFSATADSVSASVSTSISDIVVSCYALDAVGSAIQGVGGSVLGVYGALTQSVIDSGMQMQDYRMQLSALYGSIEAGEEKMKEIKEYAMSSVFDIQSLIPAVTTMKAVGIEAMEEITTSSGQHTQKLLDYASDIAAMIPNMRNAYGTGVQAAMGAIKEYVAEGNALSLKRGAGLDITGLLGEEKGSTMEERARQVADLVEQLGIVGYTAQLAGTPTQRLSNMQDALFNSLTKIADSGVFEKYCDLLEKLSNWVFSLVENEDTFNTITGVLADTVSALLKPLDKLLDFLIENGDAIINWIKLHPELTKNILITVAAVSAMLVVGGAFLKLVAAIGLASVGLSFLKGLPAVLRVVGTAFGALVRKAAPFIALAGTLYYIWSKNLFGIRSTFSKVFKDVATIYGLVADAWADNTLSYEAFEQAKNLGILPLIEALLQLKYYWDFFVEGFNKGFDKFFERIEKAFANLGITIDITGLVAAFGRLLKSLVDIGQEDKWEKIGEVVGEIAGGLVTLLVLSNALKGVGAVVSFVAKMFSLLLTPFKWIFELGKILFSPLLNGLKNLFSVIQSIFTGSQIAVGFSGISALIGGIVTSVVAFVAQLKEGFSWFWEIIKWIGLAIAAVGAIVLGAPALVAGVVAAVVGALTTLVVIIKDNWASISAFLSNVGGWIYDNVIKPVADFFVALWGDIVKGVSNAWQSISDFFSDVASWVSNNIIQPVSQAFSDLWDDLVKGVKDLGDFLSNIPSWVYDNVIAPIVDFFMTYIYPFVDKVGEICGKIIEIVTVLGKLLVQTIYNNVLKPIGTNFSNLWKNVVNGIQNFITNATNKFTNLVNWVNNNVIKPIGNFFSNLWNDAVSGVKNFISDVQNFFSTLPNWIDTNVLKPISSFFSNLWKGLTNGVQNFIKGFVTFFSNAVTDIKNFFSPLTSFFKNLWDDITKVFSKIGSAIADAISGAVKNAVNRVLSGAASLINGFIDSLNKAIRVINALPGVSIGYVSRLSVPRLAMGGIVDSPILAQIGEDGKEAVVPLENNDGWIDEVATKIAPKLIAQPQLQESSKAVEEHNDYSVTFAAGSIVIQLANATEAELEKAAEKLMKIIERKQQLKAMAVRA